MIELRDGAGFAVEAVPELRVGSQSLGKNFDCDGAIQTGVARFVHFAHPAGAERRENLVRAESNTCGQCHGARSEDGARGVPKVSNHRDEPPRLRLYTRNFPSGEIVGSSRKRSDSGKFVTPWSGPPSAGRR